MKEKIDIPNFFWLILIFSSLGIAIHITIILPRLLDHPNPNYMMFLYTLLGIVIFYGSSWFYINEKSIIINLLNYSAGFLFIIPCFYLISDLHTGLLAFLYLIGTAMAGCIYKNSPYYDEL